jgi:hypothetical protein
LRFFQDDVNEKNAADGKPCAKANHKHQKLLALSRPLSLEET